MRKNLLIFAIMLMWNLFFCMHAMAEPEVSGITISLQIDNPMMTVNGEQSEIDSGRSTVPVIIDGHTMLPVRSVIEALSGEVSWDEKTQTVELEMDENKIKLTINSDVAYINDDEYKLEVVPVIINDRTMLPIRFIAEGFNLEVDWDSDTQTVSVVNKASWAEAETAQKLDYSWTKHPYIAHAMGGVDNKDYSNSLEAFEENYSKGHRVFEVDFVLTSDEKLVSLHYWYNAPKTLGVTKEETPLSQEEFLQKKIYDKYTTLSCEDVLELMVQYPDIYIVTDTKDTKDPNVTKEFRYIYDVAEKIDIKVLDRIIPQIYNEDMYDIIMKIYDWKSIIYTLYNLGGKVTDERIVEFAHEKGIGVITTGSYRCSDEFINMMNENDLLVYMHTYNNPEEAKKFFDKGVHGFYTDYLAPETE